MQTEPVQEELYYGRTGAEWRGLLMALGTIPLIVIGITHEHDCPAIPGLPNFVITFGLINILWGVLSIAIQPNKAWDAGESGGAAGIFASLVGMAIPGCAIWGAAITWGHTRRLFADFSDCDNNLYLTGFMSATFTFVFIVILIISNIIGRVTKKKE
mmetsp:Transcript_45770/g.85788  ORF Transcript_45770/g.85788 Transcript_45770/m.85788 type:complete len:157 (-) Transcript_45770:27-497(-)